MNAGHGMRVVVEGGRTLLRGPDGIEPAHVYVAPDPTARHVRRFAEIGVRCVGFSATADFHPYGLAAPVLAEDGSRDFFEFDARCRRILAANPRALLLPRVHLCSPPWWDAAHPEETTVWEGGETHRTFGDGYGKRTAASFSSSLWRGFAVENLRALLVHARESDYGAAILGVFVCGGRTEEWFHLGATEDVLCDYGPRSAERFAAWRVAKGLPTVGVPSPERRRDVGPSRFLDPIRDADALDYEAFFSEEIASLIGDLCGVVQEEGRGAWCAGAFYGYVVEMACHGAAMRHGGHMALRNALADPRVDALASPTSYVRRDPHRGSSQSMLPTASVLAAGKAVFHENDVRTAVLVDDAGYGRAESIPESALQMRRESDYAAEQGLGLWWFDMTSCFYDHPLLEEEIGAASARAVAGVASPRRAARIAFVVDEASLRTTDLWGDWYADVLPRQLAETRRLGEAVDVALLEDLLGDSPRVDPASYRTLILPNLFRVEAATEAALRELLRGRDALFLGAVGLAPTTSGPGAGPAAITGLPLIVRPESARIRVRLREDLRGKGAAEADGFGRGFWWPWRIVVDGAQGVDVLGSYVDDGAPAFVARVGPDGLRAWAAGPVVPVAALAALFAPR